MVVYRAPNGNDGKLRDYLAHLINVNTSTMVCGDLNMCYIDNKKNRTTTFLLNNGFKQYVRQATHIDGGHIDHIYLNTEYIIPPTVELYSPYYTARDHDALCVSIPEKDE